MLLFQNKYKNFHLNLNKFLLYKAYADHLTDKFHLKKYQQLQTDYNNLKMEYDKLNESTKGSNSEDKGDN